jgi:hypothetical protein
MKPSQPESPTRRHREQVGDPLTDASHIDGHYRLHDVFHLAHAAVLDRSPVIRSLMKLKRRSRPDIDLAEDGGRAIAIEEAMSALVFAYASEHNYLEGKAHVDNALLETIRSVTAQLEVSTPSSPATALGGASAKPTAASWTST